MKLVKTEYIEEIGTKLTYEHKEVTFITFQDVVRDANRNGFDLLSYVEGSINALRKPPYEPFSVGCNVVNEVHWNCTSLKVEVYQLYNVNETKDKNGFEI